MKWKLKDVGSVEQVNKLAEALQVDVLIARLLVQRGVYTFEEAKDFFRPDLKKLHDPFLMLGMQQAVLRIEKAITNNEKILVYGDYDVDGTTSVALVYSYLKKIHTQIETYIPDRYAEGYGVSYQGIDFAHKNNFTLIISLDCGIKAVEKVAYANEKGVDFIICDHHLPGDVVPDAIAVLDPKQQACNYPYKELCGCGVGFKLIQAIQQNRNLPFSELLPYLDLVSIAIAADIVPITGENRILSFHGLKIINETPRISVQYLLGQNPPVEISTSDVVFKIAPKINAAGRIKHGNFAVKLLAENDENEASKIAIEIEKWNAERKELDKQITQEALLQIEANEEEGNSTSVVFSEHWHKGVIGIVASRLIETYYRPTLVFTKSGDYLAASARSVYKFDVYQALEQCKEYILQFGGHKYAAGLTILPENYPKFKQAFEKIVKETLPEELRKPLLQIDSVVSLDELSDKNLRIIKQFEPNGPGNMSPVFVSKDIFDTGYAKTMGKGSEHLRLCIKQEYSKSFPSVAFGLGKEINDFKNKQKHHLAYSLNENVFKGKRNWQLIIKDYK